MATNQAGQIARRPRVRVSLALLALIGVALLATLAALASPPLWTRPAEAAILLIGALVVVGLAVVWLRSGVRRASTKQQTAVDMVAVVRTYSQAIAKAADVDQVAEALVRTAARTFGVQRGALLLVHEVAWNYRLRPIPVMGNAIPATEGRFAANSPFLRTLRERQTPVFQREVIGSGDYADLALEERDWLGALAMVVYIPIVSGGQLTGILALGNAALGYSAHELAVLRTVAHQTAAPLYHTQLYADLKALNGEITALNRELRETNERLQRVDAAKTDFIAIASHELRTPLTQVRGYADLLAAMSSQGRLSLDQVGIVVANIGRATQRLEDMVAAMLDASQIDIDALKLYYTETTMEAVMWQCLERIAEAMRERRHVLVMRGMNTLPALRVDVQRLTQALCNVIGNAIKYTPDGGRITVTGQRVNGDRVEIVITDTGVGIDRDHLDLIFEKFYRASRSLLHSSGTTKFMGGGPGLGLRIAKGVIEAHGGRIWAESAGYDPVNLPGSAFHVVLPLQPPIARNSEPTP